MRLRLIRPDDVRGWMELLKSCSKETLYHRFQYSFKITLEMATRFCSVDSNREFAIVAERKEHGAGKLLGIGRLVSDPHHETAEYAVLVVDEWQGKGLGSLLTDYCLELANSSVSNGYQRLRRMTTAG